jgi:hypothetical protein
LFHVLIFPYGTGVFVPSKGTFPGVFVYFILLWVFYENGG